MSYGSNVNMKEVCATNNPQNSDVNVIQHKPVYQSQSY